MSIHNQQRKSGPRRDFDPLSQAEASVHNLLFCRGVGLLEKMIETENEAGRGLCLDFLEAAQIVARTGVAPALVLDLLRPDDYPIDGPDFRHYDLADGFSICWVRRRRPKK